MTAQSPDYIEVDGRRLTIQGVRGGGLFDPADLGWRTHSESTDNWRGYTATYGIDAGALVLDRLGISFAYELLDMKEPIWELDVRDAAGEVTRHRVFKQTVTLGSALDNDILLHDSPEERASLSYTPTDFHWRATRRGSRTLRFGEELRVDPHVLRPVEILGYAALATAELPKLGHCRGEWHQGAMLSMGGDRPPKPAPPRSVYLDVGLPIPFTGGILACSGFLRDLYVHMGFHPAWKFEHVEELRFDDGRLVTHRDVSRELAEVREVLKKQPLRPTGGEADLAAILAWTKRCFELDY